MFAMIRTRRFAGAALTLALGAACIAPFAVHSADAGVQPVPFTDARLKIELNSTDQDAGLQVFIDGPAWREVTITDPRGRTVVDFDAGASIRNYGLTELFSESSEPPFSVFPFAEFKRLFPEGRYAFRGLTIDGRRMTGSAILSHRVPDGPVINVPAEDAVVDANSLVVRWQPTTTPAGVVIAGYEVIVVANSPKRTFSAVLPATATSLSIPSEFLVPGEYHVEVLAIDVNGNQTLTDHPFTVQ